MTPPDIERTLLALRSAWGRARRREAARKAIGVQAVERGQERKK